MHLPGAAGGLAFLAVAAAGLAVGLVAAGLAGGLAAAGLVAAGRATGREVVEGGLMPGRAERSRCAIY